MDKPKCCPWCTKEGTLKPTHGNFHAEAGCWDGDSYCYDMELPGYVCDKAEGGCGAVFLYEPENVHDDCACTRGKCDEGESCEHYQAQAEEPGVSTYCGTIAVKDLEEHLENCEPCRGDAESLRAQAMEVAV